MPLFNEINEVKRGILYKRTQVAELLIQLLYTAGCECRLLYLKKEKREIETKKHVFLTRVVAAADTAESSASMSRSADQFESNALAGRNTVSYE
jgi:hypothetical protein